MRKYILFSFFFFTFFKQSTANVESFKHNVAAHCISFINKDTKLYPNSITDKYTGKTIAELKQHYKGINANKKIDEIIDFNINTDNPDNLEKEVNGFIKHAIALITTGDKSYRLELLKKNLPNLYANLDADKESFLKEQKPIVQDEQAVKSPPPTTTGVKSTIPIDSGPINPVQPEINTKSIYFAMLSLTGFLIVLMLCVYFILLKKINSIRNGSIEKNKTKDESKIKYDVLKAEIQSLVLSEIKKSEKIIMDLIEKNRKENSSIANKQIENNILQSENVITSVKKEVRYVRTAEFGNAFNPNSFKINPDSQSVFVITLLNSDQAEFGVNSNPDIQSLALSNFQIYFNNVCDYKDLPSSNTKRIITNTPGTLKLNNNKWEITDKAIISLS